MNGFRRIWSWMTRPIWELFQRDSVLGIKPDLLLPEKHHRIKPYYTGLCLDFGAGSGAFTYYLQQQGHTIIPVDVVAESRHGKVIPTLYDGWTLPFADDTFDTVICMFVLHHIQHQDEILQELRRVTKHRLIVGEDLEESWFDRFLTGTHNFLSGWEEGHNTYRSDTEWAHRFQALGVRPVQKIPIPRYKIPAYPVRRMIYVLEKGPVS